MAVSLLVLTTMKGNLSLMLSASSATFLTARQTERQRDTHTERQREAPVSGEPAVNGRLFASVDDNERQSQFDIVGVVTNVLDATCQIKCVRVLVTT